VLTCSKALLQGRLQRGRAIRKSLARRFRGLAPRVVTGAHRYPSDVVRPDGLREVLVPSYGAQLIEIDLTPARAARRDGGARWDFVRFTASSSFAAEAREEVWPRPPNGNLEHPSGDELYDHLRSHASTRSRADVVHG
jgi:hypothetical protein